MREILFRGKRKDKGEWLYGSFIPDLCELLYGDKLDGFIKPFGKTRKERLMVVVDRKTVGQYTGMKDKNGVRIFEGDILKNTLDNSISVVEWNEAHTGFTLKTRGTIYGFPKIGHEVYKIIGNVYDNPELLEGKEDE